MNNSILRHLTEDWADKLVSLGVQRIDAESAMLHVRNLAIASEAEARSDDQFLLDFDRLGSERLASRHGKSGQAIRKQRTKILSKKQPPVAVMVAG